MESFYQYLALGKNRVALFLCLNFFISQNVFSNVTFSVVGLCKYKHDEKAWTGAFYATSLNPFDTYHPSADEGCQSYVGGLTLPRGATFSSSEIVGIYGGSQQAVCKYNIPQSDDALILRQTSEICFRAHCPEGETYDKKSKTCKPPEPKDLCNTTNNPCQVSTGAKFRNEIDFTDSPLTFNRRYHSLNLSDNGLGKGWHNPYLKKLSVSGDGISIVEGSGRGEHWTKVAGVWQGDADSDYSVTETATGFSVTNQRNTVFDYTSDGRLVSETDAQGRSETYTYDSENRLMSVTNHYGLSLSFSYSSDGKDHITKVIDSNGVEYAYEYDANDNLVAVIYPDTTADTSDNPRKIYHYEDTNFPNHLTGITDENGDRYATFAYDSEGKAILSELGQTTNAVGQERMQLSY